MDPKKPADLDPKLKEIYERVMGTNVAALKTPTPTPVAPAPPIAQPATQPQQTAPQAVPAPLAAKPASPITKTSTEKVFLEHQSFTPQKKEEKKDQNLLPFLLLVGGIVFFAVYALFWLKFFNINLISLPF